MRYVWIMVKRILVQDGIAARFTDRLAERTRDYICGDPMQENTRVGTVIDEAAALYLEGVVKEAVAAGAKVLIGGRRNGASFEPTVISNVPRDCRMVVSESFGPLAPVLTVRDLDDALELANSTASRSRVCGLTAPIVNTRPVVSHAVP